MSDNLEIERYEQDGHIIVISHDPNPPNPRTEFDTLGEILYVNSSRYNLGDKGVDPSEIHEITERSDVIWLPVYAYIHSDICLNTTGFKCPWDSGQCGIIWVEKVEAIKEFGTVDAAREALVGEVETFSKFVGGKCYGYKTFLKKTCGHCSNTELVAVDSCWGFDDIDYCKDQAEDSLSEVEETADSKNNDS